MCVALSASSSDSRGDMVVLHANDAWCERDDGWIVQHAALAGAEEVLQHVIAPARVEAADAIGGEDQARVRRR